MKLAVTHRTAFAYEQPVSQAVNQVCLTPRDTDTQTCLNSRVEIEPRPDTRQQALDRFGNLIVRFDIGKPHARSVVTAVSLLETSDAAPALVPSCPVSEAREVLSSSTGEAMLLAEDCLLASRYIPASDVVDALLGELPPTHHDVLGYAQALMHHIYTTFDYDPAFSNVATPLSKVMAARRGVCQDFAHLAILACRRVGIPARYVSGYLETVPPPGVAKLRGADASHAWFGVYDCAGRWFDFDPTNDKRPDGQYVTTAWGRDYGDVAPLRGVVYGGGKHRLEVQVDVDRVTPPVASA